MTEKSGSAQAPQHFSCRLSCRAEEIAALADAVAEWAHGMGVSARTINYVNLMLDELVANIAMHAYQGRQDGAIEVRADYDGAAVCVTLRDQGPAFDHMLQAPADTALGMDVREPGGLGIHFVRQMANQLSYRRDGGVNEVIFCRNDGSQSTVAAQAVGEEGHG